MSFELNWIAWVTGLVTAANVIAVIVMMIRGIYARRKERSGSRSANVRRPLGNLATDPRRIRSESPDHTK